MSIISCINYKFCRVRVAGTGDVAAAKAGITGKSPTPAARSRASTAASDLERHCGDARCAEASRCLAGRSNFGLEASLAAVKGTPVQERQAA